MLVLNRQLARFNYNTLGGLVRGVNAGKISQVTEDQQIEIMKTNLQTSGQLTDLREILGHVSILNNINSLTIIPQQIFGYV